MAVAVKNASEEGIPQSPSRFDRLAVSSLVGALYVLGSIGVVFYLIPDLWWSAIFKDAAAKQSFVLIALQLVAMGVVAAGLVWLGMRLVGAQLAHGLRAGIFTAAVSILAIGFITWIVGQILESFAFKAEGSQTLGLAVMLAVGAGLLFLAGRWFFTPAAEEMLIAFEDQGWFSASMYKRSQGQRVRRGTILGILVLAGCGIYTLLSHRTLDTGAKDWLLPIPFTDQMLILLRDVKFTVPLLLVAGCLWLAFRAVNLPGFADFLIATEAEMNKVSWTTRKRLVQDTIVVLTTVILMTVFLFMVDNLWGFVLTKIGVLRIDSNAQQQQQQQEVPW